MIKRAQARWLVAILLAVLTGAVGRLTNVAQDTGQAGILRPTDQSVLETEEVLVIARSGALWLDGKSVSNRTTESPRQALSIRIPAGKHELVWKHGAALQRIQFVVSTSRSRTIPPGWKVYRAHPPQAECQTCHAGDQPADFKKITVAETCFACHEQEAFAVNHSHNDEVLAECVLCHNPHGSTEKFHLKMPRETACKQCHG
jgi:predicted CXXCH cytochrome family protein